VSSSGSGGGHDSTGLRAESKLNTPLSRCASPENTRAVNVASEATQQIRKWRAVRGSPFFYELWLFAVVR
jgi:hypothetical protein